MSFPPEFWPLLTAAEVPRLADFRQAQEALRIDIVRNLHYVLNARQGRLFAYRDPRDDLRDRSMRGRAPSDREFGLDDDEISNRDPRQIARVIERLIRKHEPRINPRSLSVDMVSQEVTKADNFLRAKFVVRGDMILPDGSQKSIQIRTTVLSEAAAIEANETIAPNAMVNGTVALRRILVESFSGP